MDSEASEIRRGSPGLLRDHLGLLAGAGLAFASATRLASVSRFDIDTAYAVLQSTGTANVLVGTLVGFVPVVAMLAATLCIVLQDRAKVRGDRRQLEASWYLLLLALAIAVCLVPWAILVGFPVFVALGAASSTLWRRRRPRHSQHPLGAQYRRQRAMERTQRLIAVPLTLLAVAVVASPDPWLPRERLQLTDDTTVVGYVLSRDEHVVEVLRDSDRQFIRIEATRVSSRELCRRRDPETMPERLSKRFFESRPPLAVFSDRGSYPECPKVDDEGHVE
jgi:hypothetical protein